MQLFTYQDTGADFLAGRRRGLLCDAPGLGKTAQALRAADRAGVGMVNTVCPASVVSQWRANAADISESGYVFDSHSYDYARDKGLPAKMEALILDEFHLLGNHNSGRTRAVLGDSKYGVDGQIINADYVWCMSGTPSPRDPSKLYPVMLAVIPGALETPISRSIMDYWTFKRHFCVMFDTGRGMAVKYGKNLEELAERLAPFMLRRTKRDVLEDWKEPVYAELRLDAGAARGQLVELETDEKGQLAMSAFKAGGIEALQELGLQLATLRRATGLIKVGPVMQWLKDQIDSGLEKMVVVCYHREVIAAFSVELQRHKIEYTIYQGGMTDKQRDAAKARFVASENQAILLLQITAGGTGLDGLQHATGDMLFVEFSWVPDDNYQALCRLDRHPYSFPVLARFVGLEGSLDDAIMRVVRQRTQEQAALYN